MWNDAPAPPIYKSSSASFQRVQTSKQAQTGVQPVIRGPGALEPMSQCPCRAIQGHGETLRVEAGHATRPVLPSDCLRDNAHGSLIRFGIRNDYSPKRRSVYLGYWADRPLGNSADHFLESTVADAYKLRQPVWTAGSPLQRIAGAPDAVRGSVTRSPLPFERTGATRATGRPCLVMTIPSSGRSSSSARHWRRNSVMPMSRIPGLPPPSHFGARFGFGRLSALRLAFVVQFLALGDGDFAFNAPALQVELDGNQGQPLFPNDGL